jgi:hypothetical protein
LQKGKEMRTDEYLGCNIETFREHISKQFAPGMSWENHGKWHIDHIIPLAYPGELGGPPTMEETIARLHYTNTQPLWAGDNIAKGNRWIGGACRPAKDEPVNAEAAAVLSNPEMEALLDELLLE